MKTIINSNNAPTAISPYSQAIHLDNLIFVSSQLPIDMEIGAFPQNIKDQTKASLQT